MTTGEKLVGVRCRFVYSPEVSNDCGHAVAVQLALQPGGAHEQLAQLAHAVGVYQVVAHILHDVTVVRDVRQASNPRLLVRLDQAHVRGRHVLGHNALHNIHLFLSTA